MSRENWNLNRTGEQSEGISSVILLILVRLLGAEDAARALWRKRLIVLNLREGGERVDRFTEGFERFVLGFAEN